MNNIKENGLGAAIRQYFPLTDGVAHCNPCNYAMSPLEVLYAQDELQKKINALPEKYFMYDKFNMYSESLKKVGELVNTEYQDMAYVPNDTTAINSVMRSLQPTNGEYFIVTEQAFPSVTAAANVITRGKVIKFSLSFPINSRQQIIDEFSRQLDQVQCKVKLAIVEHIACSTAFVMPVKELVGLFHARGIEVLLDGDHTPGHIELDVPSTGADYYSGALHKWAFVPRSCAFLWVRPEHQAKIRPLLVTASHGKGFFQEFYQQATRDDTNYMVAPAAIDFLNRLGGVKSISRYTSQLAEKVVAMLVEEWKTEALILPAELYSSRFRHVRLPPCFVENYAPNSGGTKEILHRLFTEYNVISYFAECFYGNFWLRVTCSAYNVMDDYVQLKDAILDMQKKFQK